MAMRERHTALVRLFWKRLGMLVLLVLLVGVGFAVWGVSRKEKESRLLREQAEMQLADLRKQEQSLSEHIGSLKTDRGKEEALREQFGVAKEGEGLIVIVQSAQTAETPTEPSMREWVRKFIPFW